MKNSNKSNPIEPVLIQLILFYQKNISPLFPPQCRFTPTCSSYALECIQRFGTLRGLFLSFRRFIRCNPFTKGYGMMWDPVPEEFHLWTKMKK